jgi:hypothetical protein
VVQNHCAHDEKISAIYARFAYESKKAAYMVGLSDAVVVMKAAAGEERKSSIERYMELRKTRHATCQHFIEKGFRIWGTSCIQSSTT